MIDNINVGKTIAKLRQDRGMTQQQLAAVLSVSHQAVSKWENGAALPDIQTMMELTRLFGITVEQLVSGDIPAVKETPTIGMKIDGHIQNIGNFVADAAEKIFGNSACEDAGYEAEEPVHAPEDEANNESDGESQRRKEEFDIQKILKMAPFMSREALDDILIENREKVTAEDISKLAPFLSSDTLEKLIVSANNEINWETLQRLAPFLKRELVDAFAKAAAKGERIVKKAVKSVEQPATDVEKAIEDMSQKIGAGVGKFAKQAMIFGEELVDGLASVFSGNVNETSAMSRKQVLRMAAVERAMNDGRWDWIAAHLSDIQDEGVRDRIAKRANESGMIEWLKINMPGHIQINEAETALKNENWADVSAYLAQMDDDYGRRAVLKAAGNGNIIWILENLEKLDLGENAGDIALMAFESDMPEAFVTIAETRMEQDEVKKLMLEVIARGDHQFAAQISHLVDSEFLVMICVDLANNAKWEKVQLFLPMIESAGIERLMEIAIEGGEFDAIDMLDDYLDD